MLHLRRGVSMSYIERLPRMAVTALITLAMINLLIGVVLRYGVAAITNYMDWDSVPFTWVEEVGEMALAWLTLIGAAIGIRSRSHFTLHFITPLLSRTIALCGVWQGWQIWLLAQPN